MKYLLISKISY